MADIYRSWPRTGEPDRSVGKLLHKAVLGFEDGTWVTGEGFGAEGECSGELVFTTQMTGYMEALTDPSYKGQILLFTFPTIGNHGVDRKNFQHPRVWANGCVP